MWCDLDILLPTIKSNQIKSNQILFKDGNVLWLHNEKLKQMLLSHHLEQIKSKCILIFILFLLSLLLLQLTPEAKILSIDNESLDMSKYIVTEKYRLTILDVGTADNGEYQCSMYIYTFQASLGCSGNNNHINTICAIKDFPINVDKITYYTFSILSQDPKSKFLDSIVTQKGYVLVFVSR